MTLRTLERRHQQVRSFLAVRVTFRVRIRVGSPAMPLVSQCCHGACCGLLCIDGIRVYLLDACQVACMASAPCSSVIYSARGLSRRCIRRCRRRRRRSGRAQAHSDGGHAAGAGRARCGVGRTPQPLNHGRQSEVRLALQGKREHSVERPASACSGAA